MTEAEAAAEAKRRNYELGDQGVTDSFYMEIEKEPGVWDVELRTERPRKHGFFKSLWRAWWNSPGPP